MALVLYHAMPSRSFGVRVLLAELGVSYELKLLNLQNKEEYQPEFQAINPLGKVPTVVHDGAVITEQVAIYTYLADAFPQAGLAPSIGDPLRGPYLRWLAIYGSCFEPAVIDKAMTREPAPYSTSPYGSFERTMEVLSHQLAAGPYLLGERFTAADVLWGTALQWMIEFELVPVSRAMQKFVAKVNGRPSVRALREEEGRRPPPSGAPAS